MNGKYNSLLTAKNVGIVTILCAATATVIVLNSKKNKLKLSPSSSASRNNKKNKNKKNKKKKQLIISVDPSSLRALQRDLETRRQKILNEFEQNGHKKIPNEMLETINYIYNDLKPSLYPPNIRLLTSQLIQDYAIMYTNIFSREPEYRVIQLAKLWLNFNCDGNIALQIEQINHRYALALRSRSIKEFKLLFQWLQSMDANLREKESIRQNWILRCFQCACLLGKWNCVQSFGNELEKVKPESLSVVNGQQQAPLHPLHLFEYIALKLPNQSANFTQVFYNVNKYIHKFDPILSPPLKFTEWQIKLCQTIIIVGFSTNVKRNNELQKQIINANKNGKKPQPVPSTSRFMFVYGCLVQFPCFWVQLPASNTKMQPVVLTGPWNDSELELTASYIRRVPDVVGVGGKNKKQNGKNRRIRVVRSDLRLRLDRKGPYISGDDNKDNINDDIKIDDKNKKKLTKNNGGWKWEGEFDHEEGLLECNESDLNNFKFRKDRNWKMNAIKFTCRTWETHMVITTPD